LPGWGADDADDTGLTTVLRLDVTPDTVYVGEQVLLNAEVTFAEASRFRQSRPASFEPPVPSGFWVQDLPDPVSVSLRVSEGRTVETQSYRRAYFPLSAGDAWFPPAHLHYELRRGFLQPPERRRVSSDSVRVVVRPLPQPAPSSFNGAVGTFTLDATLAPARVGVGEGAMLTVEVDGRGNVRALPEPRIAAVDGLELYAPSQESNMDVQDHVVAGRKRFRWMVVPERPGTYTIPSIEYAYFDPELQTYVTLVSPPLELQAVSVVASVPEDTAIRPLRAVRGDAGLAWARTPAFAAAQAVPLLLLAGALLVRRRRQRPPGPGRTCAGCAVRSVALAGEPDDTARLVALERLVLEAVSCVAGGSSRYDDAADSLRRQGRDRAADVLTRLLHDIRARRYAPAGEAATGGDLVGRAADFVEALAPRARGRRGALLLRAGRRTGRPDGGRRRAGRGPVHAAVARYQEGDVVTAANLFHAYARARPDDPTAGTTWAWPPTPPATRAAPAGRGCGRCASRPGTTMRATTWTCCPHAPRGWPPAWRRRRRPGTRAWSCRRIARQRGADGRCRGGVVGAGAGRGAVRLRPAPIRVAGAAGSGGAPLDGRRRASAARPPALVTPLGQGAAASEPDRHRPPADPPQAGRAAGPRHVEEDVPRPRGRDLHAHGLRGDEGPAAGGSRDRHATGAHDRPRW
jgi:hypothetical protein